MCGLIGYSGKDDFSERTVRLLLAWNSLERGEDSTGFFSPKNKVFKSLTRGSEYVVLKDSDIKDDNFFIGHVRAATVGGKTLENSHPFERGNYVLAHNGTLKNHLDLAHLYEINLANHTVDSDILTACINKADSIETVISQIEGAAALLIYDKRKENTLYVFRKGDTNTFNQRPLFKGLDENDNMYISSVDNPLYFEGLYKIESFDEDILYTIVNGEITSKVKIVNNPYKKPYVYNTSGYNYSNPDLWKMCFVRSKYNTVIKKYKDGKDLEKPIELVKDQYYLCNYSEVNNDKYVNILYKENNNITRYISISKTLFKEEDLIKTSDYVLLLDDYKTHHYQNVDNPLLLKDDVFLVKKVHNDGDLEVDRLPVYGGRTYFQTYFKKNLFRKLTSDEIETLYYKIFPEHKEEEVKKEVIDLSEDAIEKQVNENIANSFSMTRTLPAPSCNIEEQTKLFDCKGNPISVNLEDNSINEKDNKEELTEDDDCFIVNGKFLEESLDELDEDIEYIRELATNHINQRTIEARLLNMGSVVHMIREQTINSFDDAPSD